MSEWFRDAFSAQYLSLYAHRDEEEARRTVELILRVTGLQAGGSVLDVPCGAGRHAREFSGRGMKTAGLDLSRDLLENARRASMAAGAVSPSYVRGDVRGLPFARNHFQLVTNLFSSFGYFDTDRENMGALKELVRVCRPGGFVVVDFFHAAAVRATLQPLTERSTAEGWHVTERRAIRGTPPRVEKETTIRSADGQTRTLQESVRLFTPEELQVMMSEAGAPPAHRFGDYGGAPLAAHSPRVVLFGRKE